MNRQLFWKLCLIIATGVVALFYLINLVLSRTEADMSLLDNEHLQELTQWGEEAEHLYRLGDQAALQQWLQELEQQEQTGVAVVEADIQLVASENLEEYYYKGFNLGRSVDRQIHLYFEENPVMEIPFANHAASFLIMLPARMRPGSHWGQVKVILQIIFPMVLLALLSMVLYSHIMTPLRQLQIATRDFSRGNFDVRVRQLLGKRNDEISELATTFDQMAKRIGELIVSQRQLISDVSHELRTPLTRLDIAVESLLNKRNVEADLERIQQESQHIRKLVEDTLTLAWLDNERPDLQQESLDLVDLLDVLIEDAHFEFPDRELKANLPNHAVIENSNHRALGQALENIIRNALRFTPVGQTARIDLSMCENHYLIRVSDEGPGVPLEYLEAIFQPFFRVDSSRLASGNSFGLGLTLAQRQISALRGKVIAENLAKGGLCVIVTIPRQ